eukprot:2560970-Rhodomonas_salina.1
MAVSPNFDAEENRAAVECCRSASAALTIQRWTRRVDLEGGLRQAVADEPQHLHRDRQRAPHDPPREDGPLHLCESLPLSAITCSTLWPRLLTHARRADPGRLHRGVERGEVL